MLAAAIAAAAGPSLLAYNLSPSPTVLNQVLALALWGAFVAAGAPLARSPLGAAARAAWMPLAALAVLALTVLVARGPGALPSGLALSGLGLLLASALLVVAGAAARGGSRATSVFASFCVGWVVAGVAGAAIGGVQVFAPGWADGEWIARSGFAGRAVGNLRQPNHLSSLLLWAAIAVVPLGELGWLRRSAAWGLMALMVFAVVLTASRTGVLGVGLLALWGVVDARLSRPARLLLLATLPMFALAWAGMAGWAHLSQQVFGGEARLAEADLSSSRFGLWANTLALIAREPWLGVGFGEFNLAWTLTPFPGRPTAFFDHAHNLPLHLAAEIGLPLALLVTGLLMVALWRIWRVAPAADAAQAVAQRSAAVMLLLIGVHSLLEYPLWYAYFLLPTAWLYGFGLGRPAPASAGPARWPRALAAAGVLLVAGAALTLADYLRVAAVFASSHARMTLAERIADGRRSLLFAHHADYADVTTYAPPLDGARAFAEAPHYLLDTRLMMAWATALAASGQTDAARHLAARLREFRNPNAEDFFAICDEAGGDATATGKAASGEPPPFQCVPPKAAPGWREFVR
jgi:O-antigen ligase